MINDTVIYEINNPQTIAGSGFYCKFEIPLNQIYMANLNNLSQVEEPLFYDYPKYYKVAVYKNEVKIFSFSSRKKGAEVKQHLNMYGYPTVKVNDTSMKVHTIVTHCVLGPKPEGYTVNHKDGNKLNNHPSNLEYVTIAENIKHSVEHGMHVANDPKRSGRYKDGRCANLKEYKREWAKQKYWKNKEGI